jgi:hypothetical protein
MTDLLQQYQKVIRRLSQGGSEDMLCLPRVGGSSGLAVQAGVGC